MLNLELFGKAFVPKRFRSNLKSYLMKAGWDEIPYKGFGMLFYATLLITLIVYFAWLYPYLAPESTAVQVVFTFLYWFIFQVLLSVFGIAIIYVYLNMRIYSRTKELDLMLPDYLQLVSTNLKGGMTLDKALWSAIQPEFGILAKEVKMVSKRVLTGNDLSDALIEFSHKYDSPIMSRTIDLIVSELEIGGKIAGVIDRIVISLRKVSLLKEEMAAQTVTYMVFIGAIVMFISPALFALSGQLVTIISGFAAKIGSSMSTSASSLPFTAGSAIDIGDFRVFSFFALGIISVFAGMIISIIEKGDIRGGIKFIPIFLVVSVIMYFVFSMILRSLFSGAIPV